MTSAGRPRISMGEFAGASPEGRASKRDAILPARLRVALKKLNPTLPQDALDDAYSQIVRERVAIDPIRANAEIHDLMRDGVKVEVRGPDGARVTETVRVIDWHDARAAMIFSSPARFGSPGELYTRRADLVGFVNGLPLIFIELKASHKAMADAYNDNLADYRSTIPHVFAPNAFVILSNGLEAVIGAQTLRSNISTSGSASTTRRSRASSVSTLLFAAHVGPRGFSTSSRTSSPSRKARRAWSRSSARPTSCSASTARFAPSTRSRRTAGGSASSGIRRAQARACRCCSSPGRCCARSRATGRFLIVTDRDRTRRPDRRDLRRLRARSPKLRRHVQAQSREHLKELLPRQRALHFHADPEVRHGARRNLSGSLDPQRHHRHHRRGASQPIRHSRRQHARSPAKRSLHRLHRHAADRGRGRAHPRGVRRLRLDLRLRANRSPTARRCRSITKAASPSCSSPTRNSATRSRA